MTPDTAEWLGLAPMTSRPASCRVCAGALAPFAAGAGPGLSASALAPSNHRLGGHGELFRCRECGTVLQPSLPQGTELLELYAQMDDERYLGEERGRRDTARRLLDRLGPDGGGRRLLDVGCGHGLLMDEARRRGYRVQGLELSRAAVRHARERLALPVREEALEQAEFGDRRFDVIVLADVLEHLQDPVGALERCRALLSPGGALVVVTPDPASLTARIAGRRWWGYLPAHLCLIPRGTLRELVAARGLVLESDTPLQRSFSLRYWLDGLSERGGPADRVLHTAARVLPNGMAVSLSLGDERVVIARQLGVLEPERPCVSDRGAGARVHVVLPAYNAARTVTEVAAKIPAESVDHALLVDDASADATVEQALACGLAVLRHPRNRGYGANQKTCYVRAALDGADIVVMVHADNQYDAAFVAEMVKPIEDGVADVVIGSRLLQDEAIAGGMPRWKWLGNRGLTWVGNRAFRMSFSEYHTGYRAFSVPFLQTIPFLRNSDGFVFDQEIFAQIIARQARVVELAVPARYFLEASSVSFWRSVEYGLRTLVVLARFRRDEQRPDWLLLRRPAATLIPETQAPELPVSA